MVDAKLARKIADMCNSNNPMTANFIMEAQEEIKLNCAKGKNASRFRIGHLHERPVIVSFFNFLGYTVEFINVEPGLMNVEISW